MYLKAYRTDMGDLQLEAATVPTPVNVLDQVELLASAPHSSCCS